MDGWMNKCQTEYLYVPCLAEVPPKGNRDDGDSTLACLINLHDVARLYLIQRHGLRVEGREVVVLFLIFKAQFILWNILRPCQCPFQIGEEDLKEKHDDWKEDTAVNLHRMSIFWHQIRYPMGPRISLNHCVRWENGPVKIYICVCVCVGCVYIYGCKRVIMLMKRVRIGGS